jgi:hypothetical protein
VLVATDSPEGLTSVLSPLVAKGLVWTDALGADPVADAVSDEPASPPPQAARPIETAVSTSVERRFRTRVVMKVHPWQIVLTVARADKLHANTTGGRRFAIGMTTTPVLMLQVAGNPAISNQLGSRPEALRPRLAAGLPLRCVSSKPFF